MTTTKSMSRVEIKDADKGEVSAIFSTFNVIDSDRDVALPDAFTDGAPVRISSYNHGSTVGNALPVGKGSIRTTDTEAILEGKFFMDIAHAADTFAVVKAMGSMQEWSYFYDREKYSFGEFQEQRVQFLEKLKVHEVSPVLVGAGVGTRTLAAKAAGGMTFTDEATAVLAAVSNLSDRAADVLAKRLEKGKGFGADSAALLKQVRDELDRLAGLLAEPDNEAESVAAVEQEFLRLVANSY